MAKIDIEYIKSKISEVLKNAHSDPRKFIIKDYNDRINFACPVCGDSHKDPNAKRANIYKDNPTFMVCFNEDCRASVTHLCRDFNVEIGLEEKQALYDFADSHMKFDRKKDVYIPSNLNKLIDIDEFSNYVNEHSENQISKFKPIQFNSAAYQYLKYDRLIEDFENIYECDYKLTDRWTEKCIVMLNKSGKKMLGMQIRNMKPGDKRFFKIFNFEKVYSILHPDEVLDELEMLSYNKLSNFFNILNVDWNEPVTIFEGMLDSLFMNYGNSHSNSIGAIGLNSIDTDLSFLFDSDLDIQFFLDQDNVGIRKSQTLLEQGYKVFLWQKLVEDLLKNKKDKYVAKKYLIKIKDLNKLVQEIKDMEKFKKINLQKYFSNDVFDKLYLDETLYPKPDKFGKKPYDKNKYKK